MAKAAGVGIDTARRYVQQGLVCPTSRTVRGHGLYSAADIERLRLICEAKACGLTVEDIAELLKLTEDSGRREQARARARRRIAALDRKIRELMAIRETFAALERPVTEGKQSKP
ncbi:MAG: MerR family DNA-binding protein [Gammaproteobacteria bacterium]|nr:MerR family DNA-binding protein [Gammaproteobacteria bacterium]